MDFTKGLYYRQKYSSVSSADDPAGEEAGCGGPGLVTHGLRL